MNEADLNKMVADAQAQYWALTPEQRAEHDRLQRESFVRGNVGLDREEAAERRAAERADGMETARAAPSSWPHGCVKPGTCSRHGACMYTNCRYVAVDIRPMIAKETERRNTKRVDGGALDRAAPVTDTQVSEIIVLLKRIADALERMNRP